jgi:antitoxin ParD1/3/4
MPTRNIKLTDHLDDFIEGGVASGRYKNASEVVRVGLRLLDQRQAEDALKLERLKEAVRVGEAALRRGEFEDVGPDDLGHIWLRSERGAGIAPLASPNLAHPGPRSYISSYSIQAGKQISPINTKREKRLI